MKKIVFIATNRVHTSRQKILLKELERYFIVSIFQPKEQKGSMSVNSILYAIEFNNYLKENDFDYVLARGDRFEVLPLAVMAVYRGIPVIHIEGGDLSGVIDNKVRHALTQLSDYHFVTNEDSHKRLITMGVSPNRVWNFGSLDVEFASKVKPQKLRNKYILVTYHPIEGEDEKELDKALLDFKKFDIIKIGSNRDYGREYGEETFTPEDYINLMRYADVCVGNSSSLIKEASILEVPVVLIGERQKNRLLPNNIVKVTCETDKIEQAIKYQLNMKHIKDLTYYQKDTSKKIAVKLKEIL